MTKNQKLIKSSVVINEMNNDLWGLQSTKLNSILALLHGSDSFEVSEDAIDMDALARPRANQPGGVAVLTLSGLTTQKHSFFNMLFGGTSTERFGQLFDEAVNNPNVKAIVIDVNSPGGSVPGTTELSKKIFEGRKHKHIVAVANSIMASAAYWIASAADEVVITPSGMAGSIGIISVHQEISKQLEMLGVGTTIISAGEKKAEGNSLEPLSEAAEASLQAMADEMFNMFVGDVARNRGVTVATVKSDFGQGDVFLAKDAKKFGLVDRIDTMEGVLARLGVEIPSPRGMRAEVEEPGTDDSIQMDLERAIALSEI